ncbi:MAG: helix-turn-helix transcriptional regulator [Labilithrix sp.]
MAHLDPDRAPRAAFVLAESYEPTAGSWHTHRRAQLVHAAAGVLTVATEAGRWIAPPQRAIWVPGGMKHRVASARPFRLLTLYVDPHVLRRTTCAVVAVDRLVAELLETAGTFGPGYPKTGPEARLVQVLLDRLPALAIAPLLHLPRPTSPELVRIAKAIAQEPADRRTLEEWAALVGLGPKTAARRFQAETGLTFGRWRQQCRLLAAIEHLAAGSSVTRTAFEVGYDDVSSFIATFKASMGTTPARYFGPDRRSMG